MNAQIMGEVRSVAMVPWHSSMYRCFQVDEQTPETIHLVRLKLLTPLFTPCEAETVK